MDEPLKRQQMGRSWKIQVIVTWDPLVDFTEERKNQAPLFQERGHLCFTQTIRRR